MGIHGEKSLATMGIQWPADESAVKPNGPGGAPKCQASVPESMVGSLREAPSQRDLPAYPCSLGQRRSAEAANRDLRAGLELGVQEPTCLAARRACKQALTGEVQGRRENSRQGGGGQVRGTGRAQPPQSPLGEQTKAFRGGGQAAQQENQQGTRTEKGNSTTVPICGAEVSTPPGAEETLGNSRDWTALSWE